MFVVLFYIQISIWPLNADFNLCASKFMKKAFEFQICPCLKYTCSWNLILGSNYIHNAKCFPNTMS